MIALRENRTGVHQDIPGIVGAVQINQMLRAAINRNRCLAAVASLSGVEPNLRPSKVEGGRIARCIREASARLACYTLRGPE